MSKRIGRARPDEPESALVACLLGLLAAHRDRERRLRELRDLAPWGARREVGR